MSCTGLYLIEFHYRSLQKRALRLGLVPKLITLQKSNTTMHYWLPDPSAAANSSTPKPALMLIHGFAGDGLSGWEKQLPDLARDFDLYIPDLVFFGESHTEEAGERSEVFQARCMLEILELQGVSEAAVAGTSYGGFVAFRMAELDPSRVKRVVIASSGVCMVPSSNDAILAAFDATHIHEVMMPLSVRAQRKSINYCLYKPLPFFVLDCFIKGLMEKHGGNRERRIELLDGLLIGRADAPPLPKLGGLEVLILAGSHDRLFALDLAKQLKEHLGEKATLIVIEETGHVPQVEKPKEFNKYIRNFVSGTS